MPALGIELVKLYIPLVGTVLLGVALGKKLPQQAPAYLGQFLFWIGVPISILAFLHRADLSGAIWIAPVVAWCANFAGIGLAWLWLKSRSLDRKWSKPVQGSFLLAAMTGNTGYLGYPVVLTLLGTKYFAWALFYDLLGTTLGAYSLGIVLAVKFGTTDTGIGKVMQALIKNPALWSFWLGIQFRAVALPLWAEQLLSSLGWLMVFLSLILIGMRLSQLSSWHNLRQTSVGLGIKML